MRLPSLGSSFSLRWLLPLFLEVELRPHHELQALHVCVSVKRLVEEDLVASVPEEMLLVEGRGLAEFSERKREALRVESEDRSEDDGVALELLGA